MKKLDKSEVSDTFLIISIHNLSYISVYISLFIELKQSFINKRRYII